MFQFLNVGIGDKKFPFENFFFLTLVYCFQHLQFDHETILFIFLSLDIGRE
jgi:hypothetical protein